MSKGAVARRYAVALFELAVETGQTEKFGTDLALIEEVFTSTPQLEEVLMQPAVTLAAKENFLARMLKDYVSKEVLRTLSLLLSRGRVQIMTQVAAEYKQLHDEKKGIAQATVYSAKALSDEEKRQINLTFAPKVGKRELRVENIVDPAVLGGIKVRVNDRVFDGSVQGQLARLEQRLLQAN